MRKIIFLLIIILFASSVYGFESTAQKLENFTTGDDTFYLSTTTRRGGQVFTMGQTGPAGDYIISGVSMLMYQSGNPGIVNVSLYDVNETGVPVNILVQNTSFNASVLTTDVGGQWFNITLPAYTLVEGVNYSIVIENTQTGIVDFRAKSTGGYPGGDVVDDQGSGFSRKTADAMFEIWGVPTGDPVIVSLDSPLDGSSVSETLIEFNATLTPGDTNLSNATLNIWYSNGSLFNQTTNIVTGSVTNSTSWNMSFTTLQTYQWNVWGCATNITGAYCAFASSNYSFTNGAEVIAESYNNLTYGTSKEDFQVNLTIPPGSIISIANFIYNNTAYNVAPISLGGNNYSLNTSIIVPGVISQEEKTFYWELRFDTGFTQNTTANNQTVIPFNGLTVEESCSSGFTESIRFTFDNSEEENLSSLNSNVEYNIRYGFEETSAVTFGNFTNVSTFYICINQSLPVMKTGDSQIRYGLTPYVERAFFLFNEQNLSNLTITNHTLYNLLTVSSTSFLVTIEDNALSPLEAKYVSLMRWYPELNEYKVVEMGRTDENGQTILKVVSEDVDYRFAVYEKNGTLMKITDPLRMVCLVDPCELTIKIDEEVDFTSFFEVEGSLVYNYTTQVFTFTWTDPNQQTTLMNLTVYKLTSTSEIAVCSSTATGFVGVITCDVSGQTGTLKAVVERSASPPIPVRDLIIEIKTTLVDVGGGGIGLLMSFMIVTFVGLMGLINPVLGVIAGMIGLIPAFIFGSIPLTVLISIVVMGVIVIYFMRKT